MSNMGVPEEKREAEGQRRLYHLDMSLPHNTKRFKLGYDSGCFKMVPNGGEDMASLMIGSQRTSFRFTSFVFTEYGFVRLSGLMDLTNWFHNPHCRIEYTFDVYRWSFDIFEFQSDFTKRKVLQKCTISITPIKANDPQLVTGSVLRLRRKQKIPTSLNLFQFPDFHHGGQQ